MALFEEQITDTLETGAPSIKYEGDEGPQDPRQEQMLAQLKEEYMQYVFEMKELQEPVMSFEEWYQSVYKASQMGVQAPQEDITAEEVMMREPAAYGGIMDTESGRRAYGLGSFFKKITKPIKKIGSKLVGGAKKLIKSPLGKAALLYAGTMGIPGTQFKGLSGLMKGKALPFDWAGKAAREQSGSGLMSLVKKAFSNPKTLAKIGIGATAALPLLGIGTKAKQDQIENFDQSGKFDIDYGAMRRAAAGVDMDNPSELAAFYDTYGVTPGSLSLGSAEGGRIGFALGSKADFALEDVMTGGMEDELGGITGIMRQADLQRKGNVGQFYAADGGMPMMASAPDPMDERNSMMENLAREYFGKPLKLLNEEEIIQIEEMMDEMDPYGKKEMPQSDRMMASGKGSQYYYDLYMRYAQDIINNGNEPMPIEDFVEIIKETERTKEAKGGRIGAQEGGIMDLGGMEKDYRETGGFVDIGAEEKADDVPARLSVNEFVMTADAVRGAGDGDIDLGAERMEDTMKQLEQQGRRNQGASDMFEVSERLSEVV
jgi:hypothetical protein